MATEVKIPTIGESISSGILATWHVKDGDVVSKDQPLYELETDKITSEAVADVAGKISLKVAEGDEVAIGQVVAVIDESASAAKADAPKADDTGKADSSKSAAKSAPAAEAKTSAADANTAQSPAVRRLAAESGANPADALPGSGKGGRVTKGDLQDLIDAKGKATTPAVNPTGPAQVRTSCEEGAATQSGSNAAAQNSAPRVSRKKLSPLRKKIAERLVAATNEAALLTTFNEVDMSAVMQLRKTYQDAFVKKHGIKLGFMSFFVKAVVHALQSVPQINAQLDGDTLIQNHFYDVGVAVGTDKGLMVPVVRDCDKKGFAQIEGDILAYAKAARDGKIKLDDLQGGVFTISNGGIYGSMLSTPLLNMPQSGILGLHNITERAMVVNGQIVARPMMYLALSYDHRVVDGKEAVTFLVKVKEAIEDPSHLLLEI